MATPIMLNMATVRITAIDREVITLNVFVYMLFTFIIICELKIHKSTLNCKVNYNYFFRPLFRIGRY